ARIRTPEHHRVRDLVDRKLGTVDSLGRVLPAHSDLPVPGHYASTDLVLRDARLAVRVSARAARVDRAEHARLDVRSARLHELIFGDEFPSPIPKLRMPPYTRRRIRDRAA